MQTLDGYEEGAIVNPGQYSVAVGLALRGGGFDA